MQGTPASAADRARSALGYNWRPGRVYFLTLLEPLAGTTGLWPLPPGRPASATVDLPWQGDESFTAHAQDRIECRVLRAPAGTVVRKLQLS